MEPKSQIEMIGEKLVSQTPINVLFINTDQQRFDALSCAGNPYVSTPNLDRLASEGVRFETAITPQAMTAAARTSWHTGLSIFTTGCVSTMNDPKMQFGNGTWDQNLTKHGYHTEYYGCWCEPMPLADCYENEVVAVHSSLYKRYVAEALGTPPAPGSGQLVSYLSGWPYTPDPPDYELRKSLGNLPGNNCPGVEYGVYSLPAEHTYTAFVADRTINALERFHDTPFSVTAAILHPHHPEYVAKPYAGAIDSRKIK
ncbi:MAG: sulfatase-like hydrolase/transferase, partial [Armatimonadota bacterium]